MSGYLTRARTVLLLGLLLTAAGCTEPSGNAGGSAAESLRISDARIRAPVPGGDATAGYFAVENRSTAAVTLTGVSSGQIPRIEMHSMTMANDMMQMRRLEDVTVAPGATLHFEPGGNHLMLFGVRELAPETELILHTSDGREIPVAFRAIPIGGE